MESAVVTQPAEHVSTNYLPFQRRELPCPGLLITETLSPDDAAPAVSGRAGGPSEAYAARFDDLFGSLAQRRGFRE